MIIKLHFYLIIKSNLLIDNYIHVTVVTLPLMIKLKVLEYIYNFYAQVFSWCTFFNCQCAILPWNSVYLANLLVCFTNNTDAFQESVPLGIYSELLKILHVCVLLVNRHKLYFIYYLFGFVGCHISSFQLISSFLSINFAYQVCQWTGATCSSYYFA